MVKQLAFLTFLCSALLTYSMDGSQDEQVTRSQELPMTEVRALKDVEQFAEKVVIYKGTSAALLQGALLYPGADSSLRVGRISAGTYILEGPLPFGYGRLLMQECDNISTCVLSYEEINLNEGKRILMRQATKEEIKDICERNLFKFKPAT